MVIANYNSGLVVLYHATSAAATATPTPSVTVAPVDTATPSVTPLTMTTPTEVTPIPGSASVFMPLIAGLAATPTPLPTPSPTATQSPTPATPSEGPVAFSATTLCENEAATWEYSPVTYPHGKRILATTFTFVNHIGQNWRLEWHYNGQSRPALDQSGLVTKSPAPITIEIFYGETGACQLPLPRGVYEVKIFLDNVLWKEGTATIQ